MPERIREVMTSNPVSVMASASLVDAAQAMRDRNIGDVVVRDDGSVIGIVTDRDIVVRGLAEGRDAMTTQVGEICSRDLEIVGPDDSVGRAVQIMTDRAIRRLPVVDNGELVGVVSIGDLAEERDRDSALGEISAAPPNN